MKVLSKVLASVVAAATLGMFISCESTSAATKSEEPAKAETTPVVEEVAPVEEAPAATETPTFTFAGTELKIEVEAMKTEGFDIVDDAEASGGKAGILLSDTSYAEALVTFPAGKYEGLVNEKAPDGSHDAFYVLVDGVEYRTYPSDPPLGTYELTTRTPMNFTFDAEKTVTVRIVQNGSSRAGETGMSLDFVQFTKL